MLKMTNDILVNRQSRLNPPESTEGNNMHCTRRVNELIAIRFLDVLCNDNDTTNRRHGRKNFPKKKSKKWTVDRTLWHDKSDNTKFCVWNATALSCLKSLTNCFPFIIVEPTTNHRNIKTTQSVSHQMHRFLFTFFSFLSLYPNVLRWYCFRCKW